MKKLLIVLAAALALAANAFGQDALKDGMLIAPGTANVTIGFDFGLGVNAGFEYPLGSFDIDTARFTYGAKAVGSFRFAGGVTGLGVGAVGTVHFAWGCLDLPEAFSWARNIDTFIGVGLGYTGILYSEGAIGGLGLFSHGGSSYFISENMAVTVAGGLGGSYLGVLLKL